MNRSRFLLTGAAAAGAASLARPARAAGERIGVAIGPGHSMIYLPWDLAAALGYLPSEGLDVQFQYLKGGAEAASALASGSVDFTGCGVDHAILAQLRGKDIPLIVQFMSVPAAGVLVRAADKAKYATFGALRGHPVGVTTLGSGSHAIALWLARTNGIPRDGISILSVGGDTTAATALESGRVDAVVAYDPLATQLVASGKAAFLYDLYQPDVAHRAMQLPVYAFSGALTRADMAQSRPATCQKVVNALVRALRFMGTRPPADVARALNDEQRGGLSAADWQRTYEHAHPAFTRDGEIRIDGVRATAEANLYLADQMSAKLDFSRLVDTRFQIQARKTLRSA
ncbi:MAG: ABC transporter substrate-binding protein [Candidatus Velthaea sp.]